MFLFVTHAVLTAKTGGWAKSQIRQSKRDAMKAIYDAVGDTHDPEDVLKIVMAQNEFQ